MRQKWFFLCVLLVLSVFPVFSQEESAERLAFGNLSIEWSPALPQKVNIIRFPADPLDIGYPGGPQPAHTEFIFYNTAPAPEYPWWSEAAVWLYRAQDFAGYTQHETVFTDLQNLLASRPELSQFEVYNGTNLPLLPLANAAQVVRARSQYIDNCALKGISYVTHYRQDASPFLANEFFYTLQAISVDGQYYVAVMVRLNASMFPSQPPADIDWDAFAANMENYANESIAAINTASPDAFSPSLTSLDEVFQSINFGGAVTECF